MQYKGIKDKVAIVTGAADGIGYAIVAALLQEGAKVILNDVDADKAANAIKTISQQHPNCCMAVPGDAGAISTIDSMVDAAYDTFGRLDFVVPNAGITLFGDFLTFTPEAFQKVVGLNLQGAFFLVQRAAKRIISEKGKGKVVLMSSTVGIRAYKHLTTYAMTKSALRTMAVNLAYELGSRGINVNVIAPGATLTERTRQEQPDYEGMWRQLNPNDRVGTPQDIAQTCLFLLSDAAIHINGQTITVDGGWITAGGYPEDIE
ncbi:SDR family NAD(P)-dependent oxidoreductase [Maribacter sp. 2-571]|uniref:SDR family NAD(P)-dependent oxidoreductase n=1 Tax=Maribacter sp. 2-571 TaxID=3417569 RepID=UPI003D326438